MFDVKQMIWFVFITLMWLGTIAGAQSRVEVDDPAARAIERIQAMVEQRALVADRVALAARLVNESIAARKQGERERAAAALQQAEKIAAEIESSLRGYLLDELLKAMMAERVAPYPEQPAVVTVLPVSAGTLRKLPRPFSIRRRELQDILTRILEEERVPVELLSVALVESGFNPLALSRKGARGIWPYAELRQIRISSPTSLELESYEDRKLLLARDRTFRLRLLDGEITPEISELLMEKATRPLVSSVMPAAEGAPQFEVRVKHLHNFGGCAGTLKIFSDRVVYKSQTQPEESRFWRYVDIQNFSQSSRFRFEVTTFEDRIGGPRAYNFQLKEELPARACDYVWVHVYLSKFR